MSEVTLVKCVVSHRIENTLNALLSSRVDGFHGATDIYTRSNQNNAKPRVSPSLLFVRSGALKHPGPFIDNTSDRTFPRDRVKVKTPSRLQRSVVCISTSATHTWACLCRTYRRKLRTSGLAVAWSDACTDPRESLSFPHPRRNVRNTWY